MTLESPPAQREDVSHFMAKRFKKSWGKYVSSIPVFATSQQHGLLWHSSLMSGCQICGLVCSRISKRKRLGALNYGAGITRRDSAIFQSTFAKKDSMYLERSAGL